MFTFYVTGNLSLKKKYSGITFGLADFREISVDVLSRD